MGGGNQNTITNHNKLLTNVNIKSDFVVWLEKDENKKAGIDSFLTYFRYFANQTGDQLDPMILPLTKWVFYLYFRLFDTVDCE